MNSIYEFSFNEFNHLLCNGIYLTRKFTKKKKIPENQYIFGLSEKLFFF